MILLIRIWNGLPILTVISPAHKNIVFKHLQLVYLQNEHIFQWNSKNTRDETELITRKKCVTHMQKICSVLQIHEQFLLRDPLMACALDPPQIFRNTKSGIDKTACQHDRRSGIRIFKLYQNKCYILRIVVFSATFSFSNCIKLKDFQKSNSLILYLKIVSVCYASRLNRSIDFNI